MALVLTFLNLFCFSLNECYFANKGAALVLGGSKQGCNDQQESPARAHPQPDIHHHLRSMFYLVRPEETLKMVYTPTVSLRLFVNWNKFYYLRL